MVGIELINPGSVIGPGDIFGFPGNQFVRGIEFVSLGEGIYCIVDIGDAYTFVVIDPGNKIKGIFSRLCLLVDIGEEFWDIDNGGIGGFYFDKIIVADNFPVEIPGNFGPVRGGLDAGELVDCERLEA